jgi:peptide/nickel transport system substrate-binding protein
VTDQYVELVPFDNYWRGRPKLDKLINRYFKDSSSALIALRAGDIQFTYLSSDEAASVKSDQNLTVIPGPSQVLNYIGFNLKDKRFQDVRVRQAFMYAVDRKSIVDQLYKGSAEIVPCVYNTPNYQSKDVNAYARDVNKAKQLLKDANWDSIKGQPMELLTYYSDQLSTDVLATFQQMLAEAGIDVKPRAVDVPTYNQLRDSSNFALIYAGAANGPDPDAATLYFTTGGQIAKSFGISNPELDQLYAQGQQEPDPAKRAPISQNACQILNQNLPWAPMWVSTRYGAVSKKVGNFIWTPSPGGGRYYDAAETWTLSK